MSLKNMFQEFQWFSEEKKTKTKKETENVAKNILFENVKVCQRYTQEFKLERMAFLSLFNVTKIIKTVNKVESSITSCFF